MANFFSWNDTLYLESFSVEAMANITELYFHQFKHKIMDFLAFQKLTVQCRNAPGNNHSLIQYALTTHHGLAILSAGDARVNIYRGKSWVP